MTSAQAPSRLYIPQAFASDGDNITEIEIAASNNVNFSDGFPEVYESPSANNGKFVTRKEMNAIGNLASRNEFARACGGIVTFDPRLAVKIGGYPRGAVLEMLDGITYNRVISLVDDNMVDFTGAATSLDTATDSPDPYAPNTEYGKGAYVKKTDVTPNEYYVVNSKITAAENTQWSAVATKMTLLTGVVSGSVDGVNWAYLGNGQIDDGSLIAEIGDLNLKDVSQSAYVTWQNMKTFQATRDGFFNMQGTYEITPQEGAAAGNVQFGLIVREDDTATGISSFSPDVVDTHTLTTKALFAYTGAIGNPDSQATTSPIYQIGVVRMTRGKFYSVWLGGALCQVKSNGLKVVITQ